MIRIYRPDVQDEKFYSLMGKYFASLDVAKELERQVYNKPDTTWYLSIIKNQVVGFVSVCDCGKHYFIDNFYVIPWWRSSGVGKEIIEYVVEDFTDKPLKCIANNPAAIHIFAYHGFIEDGHNGKYKKFIKH